MIRYPIPPMIHGATQSATWMSIFAGQTTVLAPEFDADEVLARDSRPQGEPAVLHR